MGGKDIEPSIRNTIRATHRRRNARTGEQIDITASQAPALNSGEAVCDDVNRTRG